MGKNLPSIGLLKNPVLMNRKFNITEEIWQVYYDAIAKLESAIFQINPLAKINRIIVNNCSFIRGVMIEGSDIDEMYIGIEGVSDERFMELNDFFKKWINHEELVIEGSNKTPRIVAYDLLKKKEKIFLSLGKNIVTIYRDGKHIPRNTVLKNSILTDVPVDDENKYFARIKLLILMGELSVRQALDILSTAYNNQELKPKQSSFIKAFSKNIEIFSKNLFNHNTILFIRKLHSAIISHELSIEISEDEISNYEKNLLLLLKYKLIAIDNSRIIPMWIVHSPRFSDAFWHEQLEIFVLNQRGEKFNIIKRLKNHTDFRIQTTRNDLVELKEAQKGNFNNLLIIKLISLFSYLSILVTSSVMKIIKENTPIFEEQLINNLMKLIRKSDISNIYSSSAKISQYILRLFPSIVEHDNSRANKIAEILSKATLSPSSPEFLVQTSLECIEKIWPEITNSSLRLAIKNQIIILKSHHIEWIANTSKLVYEMIVILETIKTYSVKEISKSLKEAPNFFVYNKGIIRILSKDGYIIQKKETGAVSLVLETAWTQMPSAIMICAAITNEEQIIAKTGRLIHAKKNVWVKFVHHPVNQYEKFYRKFSNPYIWFLSHSMIHVLADDKSVKSKDIYNNNYAPNFDSYKQVNRRFAEEIVSLAHIFHSSKVFIQDYHLFLLSKYIKLLDKKIITSFFLHVPWPTKNYLLKNVPNSFLITILEGLLDNEVISFHTEEYAYNFISSCNDILGTNFNKKLEVLSSNNKKSQIQVNPISIDILSNKMQALEFDNLKKTALLRSTFANKTLICRHERSDPKKGIVEGLLSYQKLLRERPNLVNKILMYQMLQVDRQDMLPYRELLSVIKSLVIEINQEFSNSNPKWNGIIYEPNDFEKEAYQENPHVILDLSNSFPWHSFLLSADIILINPLQDGMNLVAKGAAVLNDPEFIYQVNKHIQLCFPRIFSEIKPAIIVGSKNMGAKNEINSGAIMIDPYNISSISNALYKAITLNNKERIIRANRVSKQVNQNDARDWILRMISKLENNK